MKAGKNYIGVSVGAFITNDKDQVLLVKRNKKARNDEGRWKLPGGKVEFGETRKEAIIREIQEELGITMKNIVLLHAVDEFFNNKKEHWLASIYLYSLKLKDKPENKEPHKHDSIGWFNINKLPNPHSLMLKENIKEYKRLLRRKRSLN